MSIATPSININNIVNETPNGPRFPPQLVSPSLNLVALPPSLLPAQQIDFIRSLHQNQLLDLSSFQHDYTSLLTKISADLSTLVQSSFPLFWSYFVYDKSILPAVRQIITNLPTYYPFSTKFTSYFHALRFQHRHPGANQSISWTTTQKNGLAALFDNYDPLFLDKTNTLLYYFQWSSQSLNSDSVSSNNKSENNQNEKFMDNSFDNFQEIVLQTFSSPQIINILQSIYTNTLLIVLRLSSFQQQFVDVDNLTFCSATSKGNVSQNFDLSQFSSGHPLLSPQGPFAVLLGSNTSPTTSTSLSDNQNLIINSRYTNHVASGKNSLGIEPFQHLSILITLNIFSPQFFIDFLQTYGIYEPKLTQLILLRVLKYIPIVVQFKNAVQMLYLYYFSLEEQFSQNYLFAYYSSYLSPQLILNNDSKVLNEAEYGEISFFLQSLQNFVSLMLSIYTTNPTVMNSILSTIVPTQQSMLIDALPKINDDFPLVSTINTTNPENPFLALVSDSKTSTKGKNSGTALQNREGLIQYPALLQFIIRVFDFTIPSIAQLFHMDLGMTLLGSGDSFESTTSTKTSSTTTSSMSNNHSSLQQHPYLHQTILSDFDSPFSYYNFRFSDFFYYLCFDLVYLAAIVFNSAILAPIGLQFTSDYLLCHLCNLNTRSAASNRPDSKNNQNTKDTKNLQQTPPEYCPPGYSIISSDIDSPPLNIDINSPSDVFNITPQVDKMNKDIAAYNFLYAIISFFAPQPNPITPSVSYDQKSIESHLTPDSILTTQQIQLSTEFAFPGSLFYFLPLSPLFHLLKKSDKTFSSNSGKRSVLPEWIPPSTQEVWNNLHSILSFYAPPQQSSPTTSVTQKFTQIQSFSPHLHYNAVFFKQTMYYFKSITNISTLIDFTISRINLFESSCFPSDSAHLLHNEEYTTFLYNTYTTPLFFSANATAETNMTKPSKVSVPPFQKKHWNGFIDSDEMIKQGKDKEGIKIDLNLPQEEQFNQFLAQTGRTAANITKSKKSKGPSGPTVLAPLSAEEKTNILKRYTASLASYDDDYDDDINAFSGFYGMKSLENNDNGDEDIVPVKSPSLLTGQTMRQDQQNQPSIDKLGPQRPFDKNHERKNDTRLQGGDKNDQFDNKSQDNHRNRKQTQKGVSNNIINDNNTDKANHFPFSRTPLPGSDADFKIQAANATITAKSFKTYRKEVNENVKFSGGPFLSSRQCPKNNKDDTMKHDDKDDKMKETKLKFESKPRSRDHGPSRDKFKPAE